MPFRVACPACQAQLSVPNASAGKAIRCGKCQNPMMVPDPGPERVSALQKPAPVRPAAAQRIAPATPISPLPQSPDRDESDVEQHVERPRPRNRPKHRTPDDRSPLLLLLLIGGGALALLLLACGGGLAIWYFQDDSARSNRTGVASGGSTPPGESGPGPASPPEPAGKLPPSAPPTPPAFAGPEALDFTDLDGAFSIAFPAGPPFRQGAGALVDEQMEFSKHLSKGISDEELEQWKKWAKEQFKDLDGYAWYSLADGRRYRVMVTNLDRGPFAGMSGHDLLDAHSGSYKQLGVRSVASKRLVIDGGDWVQVEWRRPDGKSQVDRVCVAGRSMIVLSVNATDAARVGVNRVSANDPPVKAFFDSFKTQLPVIAPRAASGAKK